MVDRHDYTEDVADAAELIEEFGQSGFIRRIVSTGPANNPTQDKGDHPAVFAVLAYTNRQIDGTRILATDQLIYLSALGLPISPKNTDKVVALVGGVEVVYNITSITPLAPAGTVVFYEVQARR